ALRRPLVTIDATLTEGPARSATSGPGGEPLKRRVDHLGGDGGLADLHPRPRLCLAPDDGEGDRPVGGGEDRRSDPADLSVPEPDLVSVGHGRLEPQAAQMAVRLAPVVQARDGLLADVAALGEAHRTLIDPRLLG